VVNNATRNERSNIPFFFIVGAPLLISQANAVIIDTKPFCLSEAARDNGTNITAFAHTFDECMQKMEMLDNNIHAAGIRGGVGNPNGESAELN
jgi:hypothetical protein